MTPDEFKSAMAALPEPPPSHAPFWPYWQANMQQMAATRHPDTFWEWPAIKHTMLVNHFPIGEQLAYLQTDWPRWERALTGLENDSHYRNMVNQSYHLKVWEDTTFSRINELNTIAEFGGGYGALCQLARRMGFQGRYVIHDLPEFALLQDYWLSTHGLTVEHSAEPVDADLFVALYSASETDRIVKTGWLPRVTADSYLVLFSGRWGDAGDVDNWAWANDFMEARPDCQWTTRQLLGRPDYYALGWR